MAKGPAIYDIDTLIQAGIDPKTGLPLKMGAPYALKGDIRKTLRVLDEANAVNRYKWYNLPNGLTGQLLERMLYYKGQVMFFYMPTDDTFYCLPYALDGTIDVYGRFVSVTPLPFNGTAQDKKDAWITGLTRDVVYEMIPLEQLTADDLENKCVLLKDYTEQISQTNIARQILQDPILDAMAEAFPMARTSLLANSGIKGVRVADEDQQTNVKLASQSITAASLSGDPWIPIVGSIEFQELTDAGSALKSEEYLLYMQALDNYRLSLYGLKNGGLFQKKAHMLEAEQEMNDGNVGLVYQDGLTIRQRFCDLVNSIWGLGIACEASESVVGIDRNMDGMIGDEQDQSGTIEGQQEPMMEGENDYE